MTEFVRARELTEAELQQYREDGYLVLPEFLETAKIEAAIEEVYQILEHETGLSRDALAIANAHADRLRQSQAYLRGSLIDALINSKNTRSIAGQLIGGEAIRYNPFTAFKGRGGAQFDFHQDNNYTQHRPALGSLNIWVALTDMSEENGCLRMEPGSHNKGVLDWADAGDAVHRKLAVEPEQTTPLVMKAGDAVAFTRLTVHGSGPNLSDEPRIAYALQYHRDDVEFIDARDGAWKLLTEHPRFQTPPLEALPG